jgi:hypothetical protein
MARESGSLARRYPAPPMSGAILIQGMRRSGTTILYDALLEDPGLHCFYEPLREDTETPGAVAARASRTLSPRRASCAGDTGTRTIRAST